MKPHFFLYTLHVILTDRGDLDDFACVDFGVWNSHLLCQLCFANFAILTDSKDIFIEHKVTVDFSDQGRSFRQGLAVMTLGEGFGLILVILLITRLLT